MRMGHPNSSLNLPTLLSFNELAWIAVSAMALFCGYLLRPSTGPDPAAHALALSNQLAQATAGQRALSNELANTHSTLNQFSNALARTEKQAQSLAAELVEARTALTDVNDRLDQVNHRLAEVERQRADANQSNTWLLAELNQATNRLARTEKEREKLATNYHQASIDLKRAWTQITNRPSEGNIRKELLSLRGAMSNVVILLDRSSSMSDGRRWEDSLRVIESWLEYLPIENCLLITFSTDCDVFPADERFLRLGGRDARARGARDDLLNRVRSRPPDGNTATVEALRRAYACSGVDTIILFTDGEPLDLRRAADRGRPASAKAESQLTLGERRRISQAQMEEALALSREHQQIPINVVALADYFADWKSKFLLGLANNTGGAFLGR